VPPLTTASDVLRSVVQPTDPAVYRLLRERAEAVCRRYERPASLVRAQVNGLPELQDRVGRRELRRRLTAFAHALRQLVRNTDAVGLDDDGSIEILLVETDEAGARVACQRLEQRLAAASGASLDVTLSFELLPTGASA
jgi:PleD family two-component response regulator